VRAMSDRSTMGYSVVAVNAHVQFRYVEKRSVVLLGSSGNHSHRKGHTNLANSRRTRYRPGRSQLMWAMLNTLG
jgi:hypothetical protein